MFKKMAEDDNLEEILFKFNNHVFMLLYSNFGNEEGVRFESLMKFDEWDFFLFAKIEV